MQEYSTSNLKKWKGKMGNIKMMELKKTTCEHM